MLEQIGGTPDLARWAAEADAALGRVVRVDRGVAEVLTEDGLVRAGFSGCVLAEVAQDPVATPTAGDWVVVRGWPDHRCTLDRVLPRTSVLVRATAGKQSHGQVLCANADHVLVVVGLHPEPVLGRVERLLALAWESGAVPIVVLTKTDLVNDADFVAEDVAAVSPGVEVVATSTVTGTGLARLREIAAAGRTLALVGASGHGKSSLVNALVGAALLRAREIRADGRGRHTSVRRELVLLPDGGALIDTPGLRGVGMTGRRDGLARAFAEIEELAVECRFRDCSHDQEAGCAVKVALEHGEIPVRRYDSWVALRQETERAAVRSERLARRRLRA